METSGGASELEKTIAAIVRESPGNRLKDFDGQEIFSGVRVGIADGDDALFERFQSVVSPNHILPRAFLERVSAEGSNVTQVRVISWALAFAEPIRRSNRSVSWPSKMYSAARNNGGALNFVLSRKLGEYFRNQGYVAEAPRLTDTYDAFRLLAVTFASTWSERHIAYAAGLGRFGLNGSLITPLGSHVRLGSLVVNSPLDLTMASRGSYRAECWESGGKVCGQCILRCPVGAISSEGLDKEKCYAMRQAVRSRHLVSYAREMELHQAPIVKNGNRISGYSLGCALCQCGVSCEAEDPFSQGKYKIHDRC